MFSDSPSNSSPSSPPSSDVSLIIDHRYFPHIVDLIFDFAPLDSLYALSRVCSDWRGRVASQFEHVAGFRYKRCDLYYTFYCPLSKKYPDKPDLDGNDELKLFQYCRILDIDDSDPVRPHALGKLQRELIPWIDTVRFRRLKDPDDQPKILPNVRRIVFSDPMLPRSAILSAATEKLVVNLSSISKYKFREIALSAQLREVVLIVNARPCIKQHKRQPHCPDTLRCLETIIDAIDTEVPITLVGADQLPISFFHPVYAICGNKLYEYGQHVPNVCLKTLAEYKAEIGEKEFAIESGQDCALREEGDDLRVYTAKLVISRYGQHGVRYQYSAKQKTRSELPVKTKH